MSTLDSRIQLKEPSRTDENIIITEKSLAFVAELHRKFEGTRQELLNARAKAQTHFDAGNLPGYLEETSGAGLKNRSVEVTGTCDSKTLVNACNSGAQCYLADLEDNCPPMWRSIMDSQINLYQATRGHLSFYNDSGDEVSLNHSHATILVRPRGLHLNENGLTVDGQVVSAAFFDFGLYFALNSQELVKNGRGPYFYLPKLEHYLEARMWNDIFLFAEETFSLPVASARASIMIETLPATFQVEEIVYELRRYVSGVALRDTLFSAIKCFRNHKQVILPDRNSIGSKAPAFLRNASAEVLKICRRRNIMAIGSMNSEQWKKNMENEEVIRQSIKAQKVADLQMGFGGTWIASPEFVEIAQEIYTNGEDTPKTNIITNESSAYTIMDWMDGNGTYKVSSSALEKTAYTAIKYISSWLSGEALLAINGYWEDAAVGEVSRCLLWNWTNHGAYDTSERIITQEMVTSALDDASTRVKSENCAEEYVDAALGYLKDKTKASVLSDYFIVDLLPRLLQFYDARRKVEVSSRNMTAKEFYVMGFPIAKSKSPIIHNTGYKLLGLPHVYKIFEIQDVNKEVLDVMRGPTFGGTSVTMPHKISVLKYMHEISPIVKFLRAVNTITRVDDPVRGRILTGENTDWIGIKSVLCKGTLEQRKFNGSCSGLVIGAGGAARAAVYAMHNIGVKTIYIYNRTQSKITEISQTFGDIRIIPLSTLGSQGFTEGPPALVVGTLPSHVTTIDNGTECDEDKVQLHEYIFSRREGGSMLDMAYLPRRTPLIKLAEMHERWSVAPGIMVLIEQGLEQFKIWTSIDPPAAEIEKETLKAYAAEFGE